MNNDLEQFSEEYLKDMQKHMALGMTLGHADVFLIRQLIDLSLAAKQAKPIGFVGKSYAMTYFMPPQDSGVEIDDLIYTTPPANSPAIPDGWKLVPIEPNAKMIGAASGQSMTPIKCWEVMLAAAPKPDGPLISEDTKSDGWIKCSERMPVNDNPVNTSNGVDVGKAWWDGDNWMSWPQDTIAGEITHWMPLPAAPKPESE